MCLGVPGRIVETWCEDGAVLARVDFLGEERRVCLNYLPDLAVGDYVIVHAGFALTLVTADEADRTVAMMREYGLVEPETVLGAAAGGP